MPNLILHIGTEKTGTTAIQQYLRINREKLLKEANIYVPTKYAFHANHRPVLSIIPNHMITQIDLENALKSKGKDISNCYKYWNNSLIEDLNLYPNSNFVLTSEQFHSRLDSVELIEGFLKYMYQLFDNINIIIYLRDAASLAYSLRSTLIAYGHYLPNAIPPKDWRLNLLANHQVTMNRWVIASKVIESPSKITPFLYERESFPESCIVSHFCQNVLKTTPNYKNNDLEKNESLSHNRLLILNHINALFSDNDRVEYYNCRGMLMNLVNDLPDEDIGLIYPAENDLKDQYKSTYHESDEWVRRKYFSKNITLFPNGYKIKHLNPRDVCQAIVSKILGTHSKQDAMSALQEIHRNNRL